MSRDTDSADATLTAGSTVTAAVAPPAAIHDISRIGRYLIEGQLGIGGMGIVYAAHDPTLARSLAVKLIAPSSTSAGGAARLIREAQAIARVSHPNVVQVFDAGDDGGLVYIVMERVDGVTLAEWLTAAPRSPRAILDVFAAAGRGLAAAHAAGLVHRDFKPENVMVGRDGRVRVLDFGLARAAGRASDGTDDDRAIVPAAEPPAAATPPSVGSGISPEVILTATGALVGTPRYMSPEQWRREETGAASDQFSFCAALYRALAGHHPFDGGSHGELRDAVLAGCLRPFPPSVPARLRRPLRRGLALHPQERFATMDDLLAALTLRSPRRWIAGGVAALSLAAAAIGAVVVQPHPAPMAGIIGAPIAPPPRRSHHARRITSRGDLRLAALAHDGARVALIAGDTLRVHETRLGGDERVLVERGVLPWSLSWSPDGRRIAVQLGPLGGPIPIGVIDVETGVIQRLPHRVARVAMLSDRELVAALVDRHELHFYSLDAPAVPVRTCRLPGASSTITEMAIDHAIGTIFIKASTNAGNTYTLLHVDQACRDLGATATDAAIGSFALDPVAARVIVHHQGSEHVEVLTHAGRPIEPPWWAGSDIRSIAGLDRDGSFFHIDVANEWRLVVRDPHGASRELLWGTGPSRFRPSPDGRSLAHLEGWGARATLRIRPVDDPSRPTPVIATGLAAARWSPDGRQIAVSYEDGDRRLIAMIDPTTGAETLRREIPSMARAATIDWLDDTRIAFDAADLHTLRWIDLRTGAEGELLSAGPGIARNLERSRRGDLRFFRDRPQAGIWILSPGQPPQHVADFFGNALASAWTFDGSAILQFAPATGAMQRIRLADRQVEALPSIDLPRGTELIDVIALSDRMLLHQRRESADLYVSTPE